MNTDNSSSLTIVFTGDLAFSGYFAECCGDDTLLGDGIKSFLGANDYNVINFESPVTPCRITKKKRLAHRSRGERLFGGIEPACSVPLHPAAYSFQCDR